MTNDLESRVAFEQYYGAPLTENAKGFTMAQYTAWKAWQARGADIRAKLGSDEMVGAAMCALDVMCTPGERTLSSIAKAVLTAITERLK